MTERRKDQLVLAVLLAVLVLFFSRILFTDKIIRAPDIINEYYWAVLNLSHKSLAELFSITLTADWDIFNNSGNTLEGGGLGNQFLFWQGLLYYLIKPPASVAWFIVLHFFVGGAGVYKYCRTIGVSCVASLLGALVFALAPEMVSLINAGHVLKIATIVIAPWAFFLLERGFMSRRVIWFMATGFVLAVQFFYTHWQIAYYTCLAVGAYGLCRYVGILAQERQKRVAVRMLVLNLVVLVFFLSTVAIDLFPLANWSSSTNRGAQSGANQGKGGLDREEAMSWSMPPEELAAFVIPGFFGYSRQEGGENPANITSYYWGRMRFTQTVSYFGLLPLLLLPLPLIFRRDRYTWLALGAITIGLLFSIGQYTPFYNFLFDHFPGINRFRVPKMMLFIPLMAVAVLAARGLDILRNEDCRKHCHFKKYLIGVFTLPLLLAVLFAIEYFGSEFWIRHFMELLSVPTRYEQGSTLVAQRWANLMTETWIALYISGFCAAAIAAFSFKRYTWLLPGILMLLLIIDVGRVNAKFMFLVDVPKESRRNYSTPAIEFLRNQSKEYRVLPLDGGPGPYSTNKIPVMYIPMPVQNKRWQDYLDNFSLQSAMPDILNVKYLIIGRQEFEQQKNDLAPKFVPVFSSPDGSEIVLENRTVLPKAWLVPSAAVVVKPEQMLALMQTSMFDPRRIGLVESSPAIQLMPADTPLTAPVGDIRIKEYKGEKIEMDVSNNTNALLVLGEKYYRGWKAAVDNNAVEIHPVDYILRGIYLTPGRHRVVFSFDPLPFKIGKYLTLTSFALFALMLLREWLTRRKTDPVS